MPDQKPLVEFYVEFKTRGNILGLGSKRVLLVTRERPNMKNIDNDGICSSEKT